MKIHWTELAITTLLVGAGCAAIFASLSKTLRRKIADHDRETERQLEALAAAVRTLQARVAELDGSQAARAEAGRVAALSGAAENMAGVEQMKPETLVAISAAATAFLGKTARVRSAQALPATQNTAGAWAQQGRVIVQTSHNLRPKR